MVEPAGTRRLTYADFAAFPEDGRRHELLDGEHLVSPAPFLGHQWAVSQLFGLLWTHLRHRPDLGVVLPGPADVVLSEHDVVEPDLLFLSKARSAQITAANVQGPPDLVVEVLSPSTRRRDLGTKLRLYERADVEEYWVVDPETATVTVFRRAADGTYLRTADLRRGDGRALTTPLLPGLEIDLGELFRKPGGP